MNKLAVLAFTILALLGGSLWYLASDSLNFYLKHKIETDGQLITNYPIKASRVNVNNTSGITTFEDIRVFENPSEPKIETGELIFTIEQVAITLDIESLSKAPIIIKELRISTVDFNPIFSAEERVEYTDKLLASIRQYETDFTAKQADSEQQLEPYFLVEKIILTAHEEQRLASDSESTSNPYLLPESDVNGKAVSLIASQLLAALLQKANAE